MGHTRQGLALTRTPAPEQPLRLIEVASDGGLIALGRKEQPPIGLPLHGAQATLGAGGGVAGEAWTAGARGAACCPTHPQTPSHCPVPHPTTHTPPARPCLLLKLTTCQKSQESTSARRAGSVGSRRCSGSRVSPRCSSSAPLSHTARSPRSWSTGWVWVGGAGGGGEGGGGLQQARARPQAHPATQRPPTYGGDAPVGANAQVPVLLVARLAQVKAVHAASARAVWAGGSARRRRRRQPTQHPPTHV